ncbi:hypothetical protein KIPB_008405 [Kipferlia bialata]|uniref:PDEase domain-containing protein n=1 Tax=Kipferlia bialata TaxID=797122 RepID=A0A9K3GKQ3_9EUKA|nr:hypothetical protein KIPB_008405 [Kipferlia bialata]|eukprot:g8405.t1
MTRMAILYDSHVLWHLVEDDYYQCKTLFLDLVLETDPSTNFDFIKRCHALDSIVSCTDWEGVRGALPAYKEGVDKQVAQTRFSVLALIIKLSDLSNPFRKTPVARVYAECITREFFDQGDIERDMCRGMTSLPNHMDRHRYPLNMYACQLTFVRNLVQPLLTLYLQVVEALPDVADASPVSIVGAPEGMSPVSMSEAITSNVADNLSYWQALHEEETVVAVDTCIARRLSRGAREKQFAFESGAIESVPWQPSIRGGRRGSLGRRGSVGSVGDSSGSNCTKSPLRNSVSLPAYSPVATPTSKDGPAPVFPDLPPSPSRPNLTLAVDRGLLQDPTLPLSLSHSDCSEGGSDTPPSDTPDSETESSDVVLCI